jgi:hypothetical protein
MFSLNKPKKLVAVVVPLGTNNKFSPEEKISLKHLEHYLGSYDKFMIAPESLDIQYSGFTVKRFDNRYFGSLRAHVNLVLSEGFYKAFQDYKFILMYHLDALVFSDQLQQWCAMDYDFIGAPWVKHKDAPYYGMPEYEGKVGNGGFALKKVRSFLKVVTSKKYFVDPGAYWDAAHASKPIHLRLMNYPKKIYKQIPFFNCAKHEISGLRHSSEELFLATKAKHYYPDFKIAPLETALKFAFESVPRHCYELNHRSLPFGCHAWNKIDKAFWEPFLLN